MDNVEKAKYEMLLDKERWELEKHKNFASQGRFAAISGFIGVSLSPINFPSAGMFLVASVYFWRRWKFMKDRYRESLLKMEQYQLFLSAKSE